MGKYKDMSICNHCNNSMARCPWSTSFSPVPGWDAVPVKILDHKPPHDDSFLVINCPMYAPYIRLSKTYKTEE